MQIHLNLFYIRPLAYPSNLCPHGLLVWQFSSAEFCGCWRGAGGRISSLGKGEYEPLVKYLLVFEFVLVNLPQCTFILKRLQRWRDLPIFKKTIRLVMKILCLPWWHYLVFLYSVECRDNNPLLCPFSSEEAAEEKDCTSGAGFGKPSW